MGTCVEFWLGSKDGIQSHFLNSPLKEYRLWLEIYGDEMDIDIDEIENISMLLGNVIEYGEKCLEANSEKEAEIIDRMLDCFYGGFCDLERKNLLVKAEESILRVSRYKESYEYIKKQYVGEETKYLDYILFGRAVGRLTTLYPYKSKDGVYRLSYLTGFECEKLKLMLETCFGHSFDSFAEDDNWCTICTTYDALRNACFHSTGLIITVA
jgi:hypothetical protein